MTGAAGAAVEEAPVTLRSETARRFRDELRACLHVERWVDEVADAAPYDSLERLLAVASDAASPAGMSPFQTICTASTSASTRQPAGGAPVHAPQNRCSPTSV